MEHPISRFDGPLLIPDTTKALIMERLLGWWVTVVFAVCFLFCANAHARPFFVFSQDANGVSASEFQDYKTLNDQEKRLGEFMDRDDTLRIKIAQLHTINENRRRNRLQEVQLDILASRVANKQAKEAAEGGFHGHYNLRGEKPYHRYAFAGGVDHVAENAYWHDWEEGAFDTSADGALKEMLEAHQQMYNERPPNDGHRRNILDPNHNYVGLGVYFGKHHIRYYEEFVDRYLDFIDYPKGPVSPGQPFKISFRTLDDGLYPYAVIVYYEPFLRPMSTREINKKNSYFDGSDRTAMDFWPLDLAKLERPDTVEIPLSFDKKGLYYVQVYLSDYKETGECMSRSGCSFFTQGKIQASGMVVRVGDAEGQNRGSGLFGFDFFRLSTAFPMQFLRGNP